MMTQKQLQSPQKLMHFYEIVKTGKVDNEAYVTTNKIQYDQSIGHWIHFNEVVYTGKVHNEAKVTASEICVDKPSLYHK